jgi:hypothetical protein
MPTSWCCLEPYTEKSDPQVVLLRARTPQREHERDEEERHTHLDTIGGTVIVEGLTITMDIDDHGRKIALKAGDDVVLLGNKRGDQLVSACS